MTDEKEDTKNKASIELDSETGILTIDEARFGLYEKPYTVRRLLETYIESKKFIEQIAEVHDDISERQESTCGLT